jgi:hypothetical protein
MLTFFDNQFSIDNDVVNPLGKPVRIVLERKCVWIKTGGSIMNTI